MKTIIIIFLIIVSTIAYSKTDVETKFLQADSLMQIENFLDAYNILKEIEPICNKADSLYIYILWYYVAATTEVERQCRMNEQFESSLKYGLEALKLIEFGKNYFDDIFTEREFWMQKNVIVSYFGLGLLDKAQEHKNILYKAYKEKKLPNGIDEYFNFSYFKWEDKNVWGYEWFEELPENRVSKSFSKIVYYIYSTNPDGSDKDQLYRLHVLMFHKADTSNKIDYVLTKRLETAQNEVSGTLYSYTYSKNIDYKKLQSDIKEVLKGNLNPDTRTIIKKKDEK